MARDDPNRWANHGRPSLNTKPVVEELCERMAQGEPLTVICKDDHMPQMVTIQRWVREDRNGFRSIYRQAQIAQAEAWGQQIIELSESDESPAKIRNQIRARTWAAARLDPRKWGEKQQVEVSGDPERPVQVQHVVDLTKLPAKEVRHLRDVSAKLLQGGE